MIDRDKVLPLLATPFLQSLAKTTLVANAREAQRDADWERVKPLVEAALLQVQNFKRSQASDNFLGDDDHEAWTALGKALAQLGEKP